MRQFERIYAVNTPTYMYSTHACPLLYAEQDLLGLVLGFAFSLEPPVNQSETKHGKIRQIRPQQDSNIVQINTFH